MFALDYIFYLLTWYQSLGLMKKLKRSRVKKSLELKLKSF